MKEPELPKLPVTDIANKQGTEEWFRKLDELNTEPFPSRDKQPLPTERPGID